VCCSVLQYVATVVQCITVCCSCQQESLKCVAVCCSVLQCVAVCCNVLQCVAVCCIVLQCLAVSCSVLRCVSLSPATVREVTDVTVQTVQGDSICLDIATSLSHNSESCHISLSHVAFY